MTRSLRHAFLCAATILVLTGLPASLHAQDEPRYVISQRATISQMLGATRVSLDYSRPLIRDRSDIFGGVVHWGEVWTPGANEATVLDLSGEARLNGHTVPAGRWSMWVIPSRVGPWELLLDPRDSLFHTERPDPADDQVRFAIDARQDAPNVEALTWAFPRVAQDGATLVMNWGNVEIPIEVEVESIEPSTVIAAEEAALYVGEWTATFEMPPDAPGMPPVTLVIRTDEDGRLETVLPPNPMAQPPAAEATPVADMTPQERERAAARRELAEYYASEPMVNIMVPRAPDVFVLGWRDGKVLLETMDVYLEFERENGRPVRMVARGVGDEIMARAVRKN